MAMNDFKYLLSAREYRWFELLFKPKITLVCYVQRRTGFKNRLISEVVVEAPDQLNVRRIFCVNYQNRRFTFFDDIFSGNYLKLSLARNVVRLRYE